MKMKLNRLLERINTDIKEFHFQQQNMEHATSIISKRTKMLMISGSKSPGNITDQTKGR